MSLQERLIEDFQKAKGLKARISIAMEMMKSMADLTDKQVAVETILPALNEDINSHQRTMLPTALEGVFIRDELKKAVGIETSEGEITPMDLWTQDPQLAEVLAAIPATKHKQVLQSLKDSKPEAWVDIVLFTMNLVPAKQVGECATLLIADDKMDVLKSWLVKSISHHTISSEALLWLAKAKGGHYDEILGAEVFRAMLTAMERDQFNEKKSNRLGDYVLKEANLIKRLIVETELEIVKDLTRALQFSPVFDDMDKRSLLARIVKLFPKVQALISKDSTRQATSLVVSWPSLERRKEEYDDLIKNRIPANRKDIEVARSYGDLRENHEFKSAKEEQKRLQTLQATMESELNRARGTDFANVRTDVVSIGTKIEVTNLDSGEREVYKIMGAWDSDPDNHVISYLTPLPQALLNKPVNTEIEFEMGDSKKHYRIESITPALDSSTVIETAGASASK
jgi:transcription elongation GreA/GreB family factor